MTALPHLKPVSIRQSVGEAVRRALLEGRFRPGEPLSEVALAAEMNVSRGPVREALLVLAQEGLVSHSQNYGFSVLNFTDHDRQEIQQVRLPLEILALDMARRRIAETDIEQLRRLNDCMVTEYKKDSVVECTQADLRFHALIWERSGNTRLVASLRNLMIPYFAYGSAFRLSRPDLSAALLDTQHRSYIDFLSGSSSQSAEQCVRFHTGL
jgi:DNA-binding GntR family transcriptional regulator